MKQKRVPLEDSPNLFSAHKKQPKAATLYMSENHKAIGFLKYIAKPSKITT